MQQWGRIFSSKASIVSLIFPEAYEEAHKNVSSGDKPHDVGVHALSLRCQQPLFTFAFMTALFAFYAVNRPFVYFLGGQWAFLTFSQVKNLSLHLPKTTATAYIQDNNTFVYILWDK